MRNVLATFLAILALAVMLNPAAMAAGDDLATMSPTQIVAQLASALRTGNSGPVDRWLTAKARVELAALEEMERAGGRLAALGTPVASALAARSERPDGTALTIDVVCSGGTAHWTIAFDDAQGLLDTVELETAATSPVVVQEASRRSTAADTEAVKRATARAAAAAEAMKVEAARQQRAAQADAQDARSLGGAADLPRTEATIATPVPPASAAPAGSAGFAARQHFHHAFGRPLMDSTAPSAARAPAARRAQGRLQGHGPSAAASRTALPTTASEAAGASTATGVRPTPPPPPPSAPAAPDVASAAPTVPGLVPVPAPAASPTAADVVDSRTVEFLLATTRKAVTGDTLRFTADRSDSLLYGVVRVHVPVDHKAGHVERPWSFNPAGFTLYEEKLDEKKHFVVTGARLIGPDDFFRFATGDPHKEALVFVHGFNNTFEDSAYRFAQILFDLQYARPAILFSWASKGSAVDYLYDKDSAEEARDRFATLIRTLQSQGVEKINVIAHSMGNYLAVAALADSVQSATPDHVEQLIMAAPDMSRDYLSLEAPKLAKIAHAMTLYACSTDRALQLSKDAAGGVPRAGDVPPDGPLVIPGIDTIDVSLLGGDWFGLNHDVFASNRSVMDDIFALLNDEKPPPRLAEVRGMPDGVLPPRFWRFEP